MLVRRGERAQHVGAVGAVREQPAEVAQPGGVGRPIQQALVGRLQERAVVRLAEQVGALRHLPLDVLRRVEQVEHDLGA